MRSGNETNPFVRFGIWPQANRQSETHASCNAVSLVWGSLRLAPIIRMYQVIRVISILNSALESVPVC